MYEITEKFLLIFCIVMVVFGIKGAIEKNKYTKDTEAVNKIKDYFKKEGKNGIDPKMLPNDIIKTKYIKWMLQDKTLVFKDDKYYLNDK